MQILQNKVLRLRTKQNRYTPVATLLKLSSEMSVNQLGAYHTLLTVHRAINEKKPQYIHNKLSTKIPINGQTFPMRQQNKVEVPKYMLSISRGSFCYRGATLWNNLPPALRETKSYKKFKPHLRKWVISNIPIKPT